MPLAVNASVIEGFDFIRVSWVDNSTAERIRNYIIMFDGVTYNLSSSNISIRFSELTSNTTYNLTMYATNPTGKGIESTITATTRSDVGKIFVFHQIMC